MAWDTRDEEKEPRRRSRQFCVPVRGAEAKFSVRKLNQVKPSQAKGSQVHFVRLFTPFLQQERCRS